MRALQEFVRTRAGMAAVILLGLLALVVVLGPPLMGEAARVVDPEAAVEGASRAHPLGTDPLGRDLFARVVVATRLTIQLAASAVLVSVSIGYPLGLLAAIGSERIRRTVRSSLYLALAFPPLIVALFIAAASGRATTVGAVLAVGVAYIPLYARTMMNLAGSVASTEYVRAARMLGLTRRRILFRHVAPNVAGPLWIQSTVGIGQAMIGISTLSFLGLGVTSPQYEWGSLLADALNRIFSTPIVVLGPAAAITLTGVLFAFVGEAGARSMDPTRWTRGVISTEPPTMIRDASSPLAFGPPFRTLKPQNTGVESLLVVRNLTVSFPGPQGSIKAVDSISFNVERGETVGIVGESGSGKSTTAAAIAGLVPHPGRVSADGLKFDGRELAPAQASRADEPVRTRMSMIFQDPMSSLTPTLRIGTQMTEAVRMHRGIKRSDAKRLARQTLADVRMPSPDSVMKSYPHQLSGGMRQRVMIGMALMTEPSLIIADEPTTALDVTIQAEILELLRRLRQERQLTILLISHDVGVVGQFCDRVLVMHQGRVVEELAAGNLDAASHPYTRALLDAVPEVRLGWAHTSKSPRGPSAMAQNQRDHATPRSLGG